MKFLISQNFLLIKLTDCLTPSVNHILTTKLIRLHIWFLHCSTSFCPKTSFLATEVSTVLALWYYLCIPFLSSLIDNLQLVWHGFSETCGLQRYCWHIFFMVCSWHVKICASNFAINRELYRLNYPTNIICWLSDYPYFINSIPNWLQNHLHLCVNTPYWRFAQYLI